MSELKVTFKLDGVAEEAAKAYKTIQDAFKSKKVSFSEWLESGGETESKAKQAGKKTGKKVMEGIEEGMKDESKRYQRVLEKMANEGEKKAKSLTSGLFSYKAGKPTPNVTQGLREVTGKDLAKVLALGDINDIIRKTLKPPMSWPKRWMIFQSVEVKRWLICKLLWQWQIQKSMRT